MRRFIRWAIVLIIIGGVTFLIWQQTRPKPIKVVVKPVERGIVERTVANTRAGTVKACRRARLSPSIGGQIAKLPVKEGERVSAGQLLMEIWNEDFEAQVNLARSEMTAAKARARAACLKAEVAKREAARLEALYKRGAASEDQTDKAVTQAKALVADCAAANSAIFVSEANVALAKAMLAKTRLKAPFNGVVAEINGELNEFVTPSPVGVPTLPTIDVIESDCFYVIAPIDEVDAAQIAVGMPVRITLDAYGQQQFPGTVRRVSTYVLDLEKQARTVDVEVDFSSKDDTTSLLAGYSADVEIVLESKSKVLRAPSESVLDGARVFVYDPDSKILDERKLEIGISNWLFTEIISGVKDNEHVVVNVDLPGIKDGVQAEIGESN
jgi:HlyD family secretion protein